MQQNLRNHKQFTPRAPTAASGRSRRPKNTIAQARAVEQHSSIVTTISPRTMLRTVLPDEFRATLKYCSHKAYACSSTGLVGSTNTYACNGLFDPDLTGVGHQPYGYDQLTPFYGIYTVTRIRAVVTVTASDDSSNYLAWSWRAYNSPTILAGASLEFCSEFDEFNFAILGASSSGVPYQQFNLPAIDLPKLEGLTTSAYLGNPNYRAPTTSNPAATPFFTIGLGNTNGGNAKTAQITVELFYDCIFQSHKSVAPS